jgi:hypothetical protein
MVDTLVMLRGSLHPVDWNGSLLANPLVHSFPNTGLFTASLAVPKYRKEIGLLHLTTQTFTHRKNPPPNIA